MTFKKCRNSGCEVQIEVRNTGEGWRPFEESGNMHQCQHSEYAKTHRGLQQEQKNNHGNENQSSTSTVKGWIPTKEQAEKIAEETKNYVDHTLAQGQKLKLKILTSTEAEGLSLLYNTFGESHNIRFSQYQVAGSLYTIAVWYEELPLKQ